MLLLIRSGGLSFEFSGRSVSGRREGPGTELAHQDRRHRLTLGDSVVPFGRLGRRQLDDDTSFLLKGDPKKR